MLGYAGFGLENSVVHLSKGAKCGCVNDCRNVFELHRELEKALFSTSQVAKVLRIGI